MNNPACHRNKGYALITAIVFLVVLTTVSLFAMKNAGIELKMSTNNSVSAQAFEAAEAARTLASQMIDPHLYNRGWPKSIGGEIADDVFNYSIPTGMRLNKRPGNEAIDNWYTSPFIATSSFDPVDLSTASASYNRDVAIVGTASYTLQADIAVKKLRADISPGSGAAMSAGYEGLGKGAAAGGSSLYFYVVARGQDPGSKAIDFTASAYRYVIRN